VKFHDGVGELAPGLTMHRVGGHTDGLQVVRVWTNRGYVALASDATHLYENIETRLAFPLVYDVDAMLAGHETVRQLADTPDHIIPGHDPLVIERYHAPSPHLTGIVVRLDVAPHTLTD
jgi:glyoxylase-like metal-dependent hydrolase (beta-lactamase superfamily II)